MSSPHDTPPYLRGARYSAQPEQHWYASTKRRVWVTLLWLALAAGLYLLLVWLFPFGGWAK